MSASNNTVIRYQPRWGGAVNRVIPQERIIHELDTETVKILNQPLFLIPDGLVPGNDKIPQPVITENRRGRALTFMYKTGRSIEVVPFDKTDRKAQNAVNNVRSLLDARENTLATEHVILGGDVFVMDNNGLHSRGLFIPNLRLENRRWTLRTFGGEQAHLSNGPIVNPNLPFPFPVK